MTKDVLYVTVLYEQIFLSNGGVMGPLMQCSHSLQLSQELWWQQQSVSRKWVQQRHSELAAQLSNETNHYLYQNTCKTPPQLACTGVACHNVPHQVDFSQRTGRLLKYITWVLGSTVTSHPQQQGNNQTCCWRCHFCVLCIYLLILSPLIITFNSSRRIHL